jgi:NAD(P)H dehydrogenase (quinone)
MNVLTVFAHPSSQSFCHAVLDRFDAGLRDAGHTNEIVDLYAIGFDPVLRERDSPNWMDDRAPDEILESMHLRERLLEGARGPIKRFAMKRLLGERDTRGIIRLLQERHRPKDVLAQQDKVVRAQALAFIAPVYFVGFPAMLKGWIERVFTLGFAYGLTAEGWKGDISGRVPLLTHNKTLIIQTTIFDERAYALGRQFWPPRRRQGDRRWETRLQRRRLRCPRRRSFQPSFSMCVLKTPSTAQSVTFLPSGSR